jgi:deoxyribodipyrimidine photo-lyase
MSPGPTADVPDVRVRLLNTRPPRETGEYVLYWMIAARRPRWNFALQRAIAWGRQAGRPVLVFEPLRAGYQWASDRLHAFVLQGMADTATALAGGPLGYYPYVEPEPGAGRGLLAALAARATVVVTDDFPAFFLPRMTAAAADRLSVRVEGVDGNGLLPLAAATREFPTAHAFRRFLQATLPGHLAAFPADDPVAGSGLSSFGGLPVAVARDWPAAGTRMLAAGVGSLSPLPIDHTVKPVDTRGGHTAAADALEGFLRDRLPRYATERNQPESDAASGLSPWLHFGHLSVHQVFADLMTREGWTSRRLPASGTGQREGWWGVSPSAEAFLDELVTWRELGYVNCHRDPHHADYASLPAWARATLDRHAADEREHVYTLAEFEEAATHDALWNAAQRQLRREGRMHNYLRMLWGKKILEWTRSPEDALAVMIELNNKYALDGRDPNSYTGISWVLGRYDRPWAPERPVFGMVRYMSSENTARKLRVRGYLARYGPLA